MTKDLLGNSGEDKRKDPERSTLGADLPTASQPSTTHDFHLKLSPRGPAPEAGRTFGPYRLIRELGRGGFGQVWEAESVETRRRLALKVITETQASSPEVLQRFEREGRLAASINHPNCVYVFGAEEVDGYPVITMELMPGGTLQDLLRQRGRLPTKEAVDFILDIIEGLEAAHSVGILHRDVKPSNCFLDENGKAKIGDFGLSKTLELDSNVTISGAFIGTPSYASPEQVRGREIDLRSDIYSVGATLYALLTGKPPFLAKQTGEILARILSEEPTPFSSYRMDVPKGLQRVILRTLAKDRERRYSTYAALRAALLPFSAQGLTAGSLARRFAALLIDLAPFFFFNVWNAFRLFEGRTREMISISVMVSVAQFLYFFLGERYWGRTLGKFLLGLRVTTPTGSAITTRQALLRTAIFYCAMLMPGLIPLALPNLPWTWQTNVVTLGCQVALLGTMRRRNGYAGLHEILSGTRVSSVRAKNVMVVPEERLGGVELTVLRHFGPYRAVLTVWDTDSESLLVAYDDILRRNVWIHRFKEDSESPPLSQFAPVRRGRLHWLNGSRQPGNCWDAYEAPLGTSLWGWVQSKGRLSWHEIRRVLLGVAAELRLQLIEIENSQRKRSIHQIWVDAYGQPRLVDFPVTALGSDPRIFQSTACEGWKAFMHQITLFGLEGKLLRVESLDSEIPAVPLPESVRSVIVELCREGQEPPSPDAFLNQLKEVVQKPARVTGGMRAGPQLLIALPIFLMVAIMFITLLLMPASMEDLTKARWYAVVLRGIEREPDTKETRDRREAIRIILAASYGKVQASPYARQLVTQLRWDPETEKVVESALRDYPSSAASDVAAAREVIAGIRAWHFDASPRDSSLAAAREMIGPRPRLEVGFLAPNLLTITLALISIPAILFAVVLRGGALLYLFGITVQTADGRPASRWRCLARALAGWSFFTLCPLLPLLPGIPRLNLSLTSLPFSILPGVVALAAAILSIANPERGIPDFIARTHLVPR